MVELLGNDAPDLDEEGKPKKEHALPFRYSMMLPAFKGIDAVFGIEGLTNPRGMILIDANQRNPKYRNIFAVGVCVAIPPVEATPARPTSCTSWHRRDPKVRARAANTSTGTAPSSATPAAHSCDWAPQAPMLPTTHDRGDRPDMPIAHSGHSG